MKEYREQLESGCTRQGCRKIFCRRIWNARTAAQVASILARYRNAFRCSNIEALLRAPQATFSHPILDIFFYVSSLLAPQKTRPKTKGTLLFSHDHPPLNHIHCKVRLARLSPVDRYLLVGTTHLLLAQFISNPSRILAAVVVRLFIITARYTPIDLQYFPALERAFKAVLEPVAASESREEYAEADAALNDHIGCSDRCNQHSKRSASPSSASRRVEKDGSVQKTNVMAHHHVSDSTAGRSTNEDYSLIPSEDLPRRYCPEKKSAASDGESAAKIDDKATVATAADSRAELSRYQDAGAFETRVSSGKKTDDRVNAAEKGVGDEQNSVPSHDCMFLPTLTFHEIDEAVVAITRLLDERIVTDIREDPRGLHLLNLLQALRKTESSSSFLLTSFCNRADLRAELRHFRAGSPSLLSFPFVLPLYVKSEIIRLESNETMKITLQDAFFRSLFEGVTEPYLFFTLGRNSIYEDTLELLSKTDEEELRKQIKVKFKEEEGVDSGGLKNEYFQLLSDEIARDTSLFEVKNGRTWFKAGAPLERCRALGKIVGMALYNDAVLDVPFPRLLFRRILALPEEFEDLAEIEPENYRSLVNLKKCSREELENADMFFVVDTPTGVEELVKDGSKIRITQANLESFCEEYAHHFTFTVVQKELEAFVSGFQSVMKSSLLRLLTPEELERIVVGVEEIDVDALEKNAVYTGYSRSTPVVKMFWEIFKAYEVEDKKKLLQFVTGNDRMPVTAGGAPRLVIVRSGPDTDRLPSSQTCFNTLLLPEYSSRARLEEKLGKAIRMATGFFLV